MRKLVLGSYLRFWRVFGSWVIPCLVVVVEW